jgi:molecular chaperone GrpE (heat shock protein)
MSNAEHAEPPEALEESEASEPSEASDASLIADALKSIEEQLSESQRLIERQAEIAASLHAENQTLRAGELRKAQGALVLSVLRVFDDVSQMASTATEPSARTDLELVADALADALARNGIDPDAVIVGEPLDGRRHKIAVIEPSPDVDADRTVARVVRPGFVWSDGEVIRVSDVAVFKHTPAEQEVPEPGTSPAGS